jgi:hypothetical protein
MFVGLGFLFLICGVFVAGYCAKFLVIGAMGLFFKRPIIWKSEWNVVAGLLVIYAFLTQIFGRNGQVGLAVIFLTIIFLLLRKPAPGGSYSIYGATEYSLKKLLTGLLNQEGIAHEETDLGFKILSSNCELTMTTKGDTSVALRIIPSDSKLASLLDSTIKKFFKMTPVSTNRSTYYRFFVIGLLFVGVLIYVLKQAPGQKVPVPTTSPTANETCVHSSCWGHLGCNYEICTRSDGSTYNKFVQ